MTQETATPKEITKRKKGVVLGLDYMNKDEEDQPEKLSQEEKQELNDLYNRLELHRSAEVEDFRKEYADFIKEYAVTEDNVFKLSFFMDKLDKQERKFFAEALEKIARAEDGFSPVPGIHRFEPVLNLYNKLKETGRINEDL